MENNKLEFHTRFMYVLLGLLILGMGGCKWNSDYRSRIQPSPNTQALSAEEAQLQDAINESEPESLQSVLPAKPIPPAPDLPF
jgi:hypothetical protein